MAEYKDFIPQNIAPPNAKRIGVYKKNGEKIGQIALGSLAFPNAGEKLYSFGLLSDVHIPQYQTAESDFATALKFYESQNVDFICVNGDLSWHGYADELSKYKALVETNAPNTPVYAIPGNHDVRDALTETIQDYTGHPFYYSIAQGNDVYIFVGCWRETPQNGEGRLFTVEELQWLYETLESNRNKRCFVFSHVLPTNGCGNALNLYDNSLWVGVKVQVFESLMRHYPNVILFHGHSHLKFSLQEADHMANYDDIFGCHSVHIPSCACPRDADDEVTPDIIDRESGSEGYVVDVYENGIHLRGRDFVKGEFLPIASYWLDTTLQTIPAGTYTDSTGTIKP